MEKKDLRIVFMVTPDFAVASLKALIDNQFNVVAVVTQPDKPVGRHGSVLQPSAVKIFAQQHQIPVLQPERMKDEGFVRELRSYRADLQVVVAFRMLPEVVWAMPRFGTFNVHAALLPQYRGAAPINWAVINGETETGVTTFFLDHDIDTGRIIMKKTFPIPDDADAEYVYNGLMQLGAEACIQTADLILSTNGEVISIAQEEYGVPEQDLKLAPKIFRETCCIDWQKTAKLVYDFVRGLSPYPGAWTTLATMDGGQSQVLKIFKTAKTSLPSSEAPGSFVVDRQHLYVCTADFLVEILELQLSGKKRMTSLVFLNGFKNIEKFKLA